jgi:hypothetical protein
MLSNFFTRLSQCRVRAASAPAWALALALSVSCSDSLLETQRPPGDKAPPLSWEWQYPLPQGNDLNDVWFDLSGVGYTVGDAGTILRYDGARWELMPSPVAEDINAVWGYPGGIVTAVGGGGALLSFDGDRWVRENQHTIIHYTDVWGTDSTHIYAVSAGGSIALRNPDNGRWYFQGTFYGSNLTAIWGWSEDELWAFTDDGSIARRDSSGWTLTEFEAGVRFTDAWGCAPDTIYATFSEGGSTGLRLIRYDGTSWDYVDYSPSSLPGDLGPMMSVWGRSGSDVYTASNHGLFHFDGSDWHRYSKTEVDTTNAIYGDGQDRVILVGDYGNIRNFDGSAFEKFVKPTPVEIDNVWGSGPDNVYAAGYLLFHYDGSNWTHDLIAHALKDVSGRGRDDIIAVGPVDWCIRYDGTAWTKVRIGNDLGYLAVWMAPSSEDIFAGSWEGSIYRFDGIAWSKAHILETGAVTDIWGSSAEDVWAVGGDNGTIVHFDGSEWHGFGDDFGVRGVGGTGPNDVYAAGDAPLWHYNGTSWSRVKLDKEYPLNGVWCASTGEVFAVGPEGRTLYYDGTRWLWLRRVTHNDLYGVWGASATDVYATGFNAILHLETN